MLIALACSPELREQGGTEEDRLVAAAIEARGHRAQIEAWGDARVAWDRFDGTLLRSCWDYHLRLAQFRGWLESLPACVWNPTGLVSWNADKRYLFDLADRDIEIVPTRLIDTRSRLRLGDLPSAFESDALVVKPVVGASAFGMWRATRDELARLSGRFTSEKDTGPLLVQPLLPEVLAEGEWSLIVIDGELTHAVLKRPGDGDFRVQSELGGTAELRDPPGELRHLARRVVAALDEAPLYARVDVVRCSAGPVLMELELIEPQLFLEQAPDALDRLVDALLARLASS